MANNWAIVIGINQYRFLQPLKYAKRDAEAMHSFLIQEAKFDRIFLFTDDSPPISGKSTEPFRANLLRVLRQIFEKPFMKDGDNFWFFFSGHGIPHNGQDYLMPLDGDPEDIENTGISTNTITNYLRSCGADNAVMILDACRSGGKKSGEGIGRQTEAEARQTGVISFFSCSPDQYSYELEAIQQGAFTSALLEGLGIRGRCATVERINQYLEHRVPELVTQYLGRVRQVPYTIAEPLNRSHLILMPQHASLADIAILKNDAYCAERKQDWDLAQQLWIRVLAAASGQDMEAIEALQNLSIQLHTRIKSFQPKQHQVTELFKSFKAPAQTIIEPKSILKKSTPQVSSTTSPLNSLRNKHIIRLILLFFVIGVTSISFFFWPAITSNPTSMCPKSPRSIPLAEDIKPVSLSDQPLSVSGQLNDRDYRGYTFKAKADQRFSFRTKDDLCIWFFAPSKQFLGAKDILYSSSLPRDGDYMVLVSALTKSSKNFTLEMSLQPAFPTLSVSPTATAASDFSQSLAVQLVRDWLNARSQVFAPPFNREIASQYTSGPLYYDITKPNGSIDWLQSNNFYFIYRGSNVDKVWSFKTSESQGFLEVTVSEDRSLFGPKGEESPQSGKTVKKLFYIFKKENGSWKIYDYKEI